MKKKKSFIGTIAVLVILFLSVCGIGEYKLDLDSLSRGYISFDKQKADFTGDGNLNVFYIDVGQGDCEFIEFPDGRTMLIDAGEHDAADTIIDFLNSRGISKLDYIVPTHPHSDHIGGMQYVLREFDLGTVYLPDAANETVTYDRMLDAIEDGNAKVKEAKAGVSIISEDGLNVDIIAPNSTGYEELNDYSAVVKITYGNTAFLFMGDAEKLSEDEIRADVSCDVVKVGHHGSKTSSSTSFVNRTKADYAVVSVGAGNEYGLPKAEVLNRWKKSGAEVLRTDEEGTIGFTSDGNTVGRIEL